MLNGWQRIWIVFAVILLIFPGVLLVTEIPTKDDIYLSWANETIELTLTLDEFEKLSVWNVREHYKDISDQELIKKIQDKFSDSIRGDNLDFNSINKEYESRLNNLVKKQALAVGIYLGVWLGVMVALYALGWSIGWIIRGFKIKNS